MNDLIVTIANVMGSGLRQAVPMILVAMGGLIAERSGTVDIGLEGKLLMSAFAGAATASLTGSLPLAVLAAVLVSVVFSLLHGFATISQKGDHVVSGLAINVLASGLTLVLGQAWFQKGGQTPLLPDELRFKPIVWPGVEVVRDVPVIGPVYEKIISGHHVFTYIAIASVFLTAFLLYRTRMGLRIRAVGEEPNAVDTAGLSVVRLRYLALVYTGIMCGLAGVALSMAQNGGFVREMSAGMGFMALAAVIFGKWRPWPAFAACLLFGLLGALSDRLQGVPLFGVSEIPSQVFSAMPYVLTIVLLASFVGKAVAPKAIGRPYVKER
ncbi:ABC transporter permease [Hydromonas duriensis]|uniref:Nucleoside ABC transporter membrane protein n=1 Tax=Hydromonas duriensis TaxID=1527608 RepID=A0A4R6YBW8_9BURK|nr:ABC transporter permease [Hydromonas duriensis]TDR33109.1 nucleoside ABC transporter membrane protein [Hydromonas duriensis]